MSEGGPTVAALLEAAVPRLRSAGIADPRREAWRLWADLRDVDGPLPAGEREREVDRTEALTFARAVGRRARGEPLPYVTGVAGFRRLTLRSDRRALIPRPETEGLVDLVLARVSAGRVADVGTGSGCLALALADEGNYEQVLGLDRSRAALALAQENRERTGLRVSLVAADFLTPIALESLHAVVSNPPYLTQSEYDSLDGSVRDWEPAEALVSGPDGMAAIRQLAGQAFGAVGRGGWLALEVDASRAEEAARIAAGAGWGEPAVHMDLFGRARYVLARRSEAE